MIVKLLVFFLQLVLVYSDVVYYDDFDAEEMAKLQEEQHQLDA